MQAIFREIVDGDVDAVRARVERDPALVNAAATGAPKKFAGQSPLQVAVRTAQFAIADYLLAHGADVNFVDVDSPGGWSAPVVHDAAVAAVMRARKVSNDDPTTADAAFATLKGMLDAGADVHATDSMGATLLSRTARAAKDLLPHRDLVGAGHPPPAEMVADLRRVFDELRSRGADPDAIVPQLGKPLTARYRGEPVVQSSLDSRMRQERPRHDLPCDVTERCARGVEAETVPR